MRFFVLFLTVFILYSLSYGLSFSEFIYPGFSASNSQLVDDKGSFLFSRNGTFRAAIFSPGVEGTNFCFCVIHVPSNAIIWSANWDAPISDSGRMNLTVDGITIVDQDGNLVWSTPPLRSPAHALWLTEVGNLVLLDQVNGSLWESFHYPTDTVVIGQHLPVGASLSGAGGYKLTISAYDAVFQWHGSTYWELSMDSKAYRNSNYFVEYMEINRTGLYLLGRNGSIVIVQVVLSPSDFRIAKLDASGHFAISSFSGGSWIQELVEPVDRCLVPSICGRSGLCKDGTVTGGPSCSCPTGFHVSAQNSSGCVPSNGSYSFPFSCDSSSSDNQLNLSMVSYLTLGTGVKYFANTFSNPMQYNVNFSECEDICSMNCSCLGVFYENSSGSCYMLEDELGSFMSSSGNENDLSGYVKVVVGSSPPNSDVDNDLGDRRQKIPIAAIVLLPFTGFFLLVALSFLFWRRWRILKTKDTKLVHTDSPASRELDVFYIPGLPKRFEYKELESGTENFKTLMGSGGFGSVYKGELYDKTVVAVKKITNSGVQGKKEFFTEIAIIGNVHHVNLVKLKGFCAHGSQRLLVYEYMNHGSLDRTLFGSGPVLEWQERLDIVLGTARGLAYLHSGCAHKIIHCDIKPENILLDDHFQAKISDFGLSKLLNPEQSSLFTTMRGTRGYIAPEWLTSSAISEKTDVYSFGMVLLEIVSGRKNCSFQSHTLDQNSSGDGGQSSLSSGSELVYFPLFALEKHEQGRYLDLSDPRLEGRVTSEEVEKLVLVALTCVHEEPALRPNMKTVVGMLEGGIPLGQPRMESLNFLRFYGRRFTEASMIEEENGQNGTMLYRHFLNTPILEMERPFLFPQKLLTFLNSRHLRRTQQRPSTSILLLPKLTSFLNNTQLLRPSVLLLQKLTCTSPNSLPLYPTVQLQPKTRTRSLSW